MSRTEPRVPRRWRSPLHPGCRCVAPLGRLAAGDVRRDCNACNPTQPTTRPAAADADPVPRVLPPPEPKKGAKPKPDPNAEFVGPDGFKLVNPRVMEHDRELVFAHFTPCGRFPIAGSYDGRLYRGRSTATR